MKKNLILTLAVIVINGYALINLFNFISKENSSAKKTFNFNSPISIAGNIDTEKTPVLFRKGDAIQDNSRKNIAPDNQVKNISGKTKQNISTNNGISGIPFPLENNPTGKHGILTQENSPQKEQTGNYTIFNALESNGKLHQIRLTVIGSQYAYNMSRTSLSEPVTTDAVNNGGGMQKVDDNNGGYNDVPVGNYMTILISFVFFYLTTIIYNRKKRTLEI